MKPLGAWGGLALLLATSTSAEGVRLPECGLSCFPSSIQTASVLSSSCNASNNSTDCFCNDWKSTFPALQSCFRQKCNVSDVYESIRTSNKICEIPIQSRQKDMYPLAALFAVAFLVGNARLGWRWWQSAIDRDDYLMVIVLFLMSASGLCGLTYVILGFGLNIWDVPTKNIVMDFQMFYFCQITFPLTFALSKLSVLAFYHRLFPSETCRRICVGMSIFISVAAVIMVTITILECIPISHNWDMWNPTKMPRPARCVDVALMFYVHAGMSCAQDVFILILPLPWLLQMKVDWKKKLHVLAMFNFGIATCVVSLVRITTIRKFKNSTNPTWDYTDFVIWSGIELAMTSLVPNLLAFRSLLSHAFPRFFAPDSRDQIVPAHGPSPAGPLASVHKISSRVARRIRQRNADDVFETGLATTVRTSSAEGQRGGELSEVVRASSEVEGGKQKQEKVVVTGSLEIGER